MKTPTQRLRERYNYTHPSQEDAPDFYEDILSDITYGRKFARRFRWGGRGIGLGILIDGWPKDQGDLVADSLLLTAMFGVYALANACHQNAWEAQEERMTYVDEGREHFRFAQADMPEWLVEEVVHLELHREMQSSEASE